MVPSPRKLSACAALAAIAVAAFLPSLWVGLLSDDYILRRTLRAIASPVWPFDRNDLGVAHGAGHFYRPLWLLFNDGVQTVFGNSAVALHAGNLVLYAVLTLEVWQLARRFTGAQAAWLAALFFALYPRHGEAVAWIAGNTDLVAAVLALAALLVHHPSAPRRGRAALGIALAALAALAKESAFVLPALALLLGAVEVGALRDRRTWRLPLGMLAAQLVVLAARTIVIGGAGGYAETPFTLIRALGSITSYVLGALTPPQLEVLRDPVLLVAPAALLVLLAWQMHRLLATGERRRARVAAIGLAWFAVSLLPALNTPLDLNTANGSRVLLLPSVGLALCFAALIDRPLAGGARRGLAAAATIGLALCIWTAHDWVIASRISDRLLIEARRLGPANGELVLLNMPEGYRTAIAFQDALDVAVNDSGRPDLMIVTCAPVHLRRDTAGATRFQPQPDASFLGQSSSAAPFDFPVLGARPPETSSCRFARAAGGTRGIGSATRVVVRPLPRLPFVVAFFDGAELRLVSP